MKTTVVVCHGCGKDLIRPTKEVTRSLKIGRKFICGDACKPRIAEAMKRREAWKYLELEKALINVPHEFEYALGGFVFDLALFNTHTLVEFDSKHHNYGKQKLADLEKEKMASMHGFSVLRIKTQESAVIPSSILSIP